MGLLFKRNGHLTYMPVITSPKRPIVTLVALEHPIVGIWPKVRVKNLLQFTEEEWTKMTNGKPETFICIGPYESEEKPHE